MTPAEKERLTELLKESDEEEDPALGGHGNQEVGWHAALMGNTWGRMSSSHSEVFPVYSSSFVVL